MKDTTPIQVGLLSNVSMLASLLATSAQLELAWETTADELSCELRRKPVDVVIGSVNEVITEQVAKAKKAYANLRFILLVDPQEKYIEQVMALSSQGVVYAFLERPTTPKKLRSFVQVIEAVHAGWIALDTSVVHRDFVKTMHVGQRHLAGHVKQPEDGTLVFA